GALVVLEQEVLELGTDVERVEAHGLHALERTAQHVARVAFVRLPVGRADVTDHAADLRLTLLPRHQPVRARIGDRDHVRLLDRVEPGDRRAVESHPVVKGALDLARGHRERLEVSLEVGEPEEQELDPVVLDLLESVLSGLLAGGGPVLRLDLLRHAQSLPRRRLGGADHGGRAGFAGATVLLTRKSPGRQNSPEASLPHTARTVTRSGSCSWELL